VFLGDSVPVATSGGAEVNHLSVNIPFDGRRDSYKGSANRIFLQLPSGFSFLNRLGTSGKCARDQQYYLAHE